MWAARRRRVSAAIACFCCVVIVAIAAAGCGRSGDSASAATRLAGPDAFQKSGRDPDLRIHLPPAGAQQPYPLVVALHPLFHDAAEMEADAGIDTIADRYGFAVVYPNGLGKSWNAGSCCGKAAIRGVDDVAYVRDLISHVEQHYPVDRRHVFLMGLSNGGMLAYRYACTYPSEIAGIGVVAASLQVAGCRPTTPVTVVSVHGLRDTLVPYDGQTWSMSLGGPVTSTRDSLAPFRSVDRCPTPLLSTDATVTGSDGLPLGGVQESGTGAIRTQAPCGTPSTVVEYLLPTVGHGWPALTGAGSFATAASIWRVLSASRSRAGGPDV